MALMALSWSSVAPCRATNKLGLGPDPWTVRAAGPGPGVEATGWLGELKILILILIIILIPNNNNKINIHINTNSLGPRPWTA